MAFSTNNGNRGRQNAFSTINITPFVDVVLVLLIIFMVTAPLMQTGVDVNLPNTKVRKTITEEDQFVISLTKDGEIYLNKTLLSPAELKQKLPALVKQRGVKDVYLRADKEVRYGFVIEIIDVVKGAGVDRMGMITQPQEEKSK